MRDHPLPHQRLDHKLVQSNSQTSSQERLLNQKLRLGDLVVVKARVVAAIATVIQAMAKTVWFFVQADDAPTTTKGLVLIAHRVKLTLVLTHRKFAEDASVIVYSGHE
jgi:hypothetical protein